MSARFSLSSPLLRRRLALAGVGLSAAFVSAGCSAGSVTNAASGGDDPKPSPTPSQVSITSNVHDGAKAVDLSRVIRVRASQGTLKNVTITGGDGAPLQGHMNPAETVWTVKGGLAPGASYQVHGTGVDSEGRSKSYDATFKARNLTKDEQTYPSFTPMSGSTVGVGMPVIIRFDVGVSNKASIERHLQVTSNPPQVGAFHWISDNEVHWRPKNYWQPGTKVTVNANIAKVPAGNGIYGQLNRSESFHVGRAMVSTVNINTDQMTVTRNGQTIRTIPITTGKAGFDTRSGTKVIVEKFRHKSMKSETIGISDKNSSNYYDLNDVEYAMRLTYSGEFLHAAPWSVGSQGYSNVSHGCTGMSTSNAAWLYDNSIVGDVVKYTGSSKYMTLTNGFGDWNESFREYKKGSALHG